MCTASSIALLLGEYCTQTFQLVQNTVHALAVVPHLRFDMNYY